MSSHSPYTISVPDASIQLLRDKLAVSTFPNELSGAGWDLGSPLQDVQRLAEYWQNGFDWKAQEAKLNELPNFMTKIEVDGFGSIDTHFMYQKSPMASAIPLLFVHGWPGHYLEATKLLPLLKGGDGKPAFHIIAPSLPNFGFSAGIKERGFKLRQYSELLHKLMKSLGYDQYVTQGGDWGFYITRSMGRIYPDAVLASHINMVRAEEPKYTQNPLLALQERWTPYNEDTKRRLARQGWFTREGGGYREMQATKPQTLGYSLADSPVALLAWIYEKLHDWTDSYPWTDDEILTWVSVYWFSTAGPAANVRIYYEAVHDSGPTSRDGAAKYVPKVKLGVSYFPKEIWLPPKSWSGTLGPLVFESSHEQGGHFAAWEQPEAIADDLNKMFGRGGPCAGIIKGRDGYRGAAKM